ncbi:hotdog domain-containing protein [Aquabacterium sp. OR-4]|uniref:hotdog domain-containing protein n=1 Tax=Aquabacterium sp. OR-4 TaxID=2978127 RepID=UPI0021B22E7D|nr:PaaI family thioesterase [Aquabacterium sp. OR-4]MDT7835909.1 PaaI family thioesterase [Aquabacterium sp. OR-4]
MSSTLDEINRRYVGQAPHMRKIGLQATEVGPARGCMQLPDRPAWLGDPARQVLHSGPLTVLADSTCGLAVGAAMRERAPYATLDLRMDYLRPATPGHALLCEAHCFRLTRHVAFVRGEVWQADRAQPLAAVQASFMLSTPAGTRRAHEPMVRADAAGAGLPPDLAPWLPPAHSQPVLPGVVIAYAEFLGLRESPAPQATGGTAEPQLYRLPFQDMLIGNPRLPALHGGVVAAFAESAATLQLIHTMGGARLPKSIDFSIDYLRAGRPEETFASCEIVRLGARVALVQVRCWQKNPALPIAVARVHFLLSEPVGANEAAEPADPAGPDTPA